MAVTHLNGSADANVNKLVVLIEEIQNTIDTLIEENKIEEDEIQWEDGQSEETASGEDPDEDNDQPAPEQD